MVNFPVSLDRIGALIQEYAASEREGPIDAHALAIRILDHLRDDFHPDSPRLKIDWDALLKFIEALIPLILAIIAAFQATK